MELRCGELVETRRRRDGVTYQWTQDIPHPAYLITLAAGEFDVVEDEWRGKRVSYWVPPGKADGVERTFSNTKNMLDFFSEKLRG